MGPRPATQSHEDDGIYLVTRANNPFDLPIQTHLQSVRRYGVWTHHGCIASIQDVMLKARVLDGPRQGEAVDIFLEWRYEDDPPSGAATWLTEAKRGSGS